MPAAYRLHRTLPSRGCLLALVLFTVLLAQGCSGWNEAYRDRYSQRSPAIRFGCDLAAAAADLKGAPKSDIRILVREAPGQDAPLVGELLDWDSRSEIPVVIAGPPPDRVLAADVKGILVRNGFTVTEDHRSAQAFIDVHVTRLGAVQVSAGWTELRGTTIARIDFNIRVSRAAAVAWKRDFSETEKIKALYFLTSDMELALKRAYCRSLEGLEKAIKGPDFLAAVSR
jgi:hypothetical protein